MSEHSLVSTKRRPINRHRQVAEDQATAVLQNLAGMEGQHFWEMLVGVFNGLKRGMIVADRSGQVVVYNEAAQEIMGYRADEVIGRVSLWDFCEECERPPLFRESLLRGQGFPEEEVEMTRKDGRGGPIGVKVTGLYGSNRELIGALATIRSLDDLRAREREHKSLVRMASIGRIISAVAHEINNPLQAVRTSIELGLDPRKSAERRQEYLHAAEYEIGRITRVIGQMRDFYRPNPGQKGPTNVNATLEEALGLLDKQFSKTGVQITLKLASDLPPVSLIDYQLEQVFLNLGLNALETMPEGGQLTVWTEVDESRNVLVSWHDSARPIDPAQAASVFDPFASHARADGLALGLSVSREIVTELGGSIEVHPANANTLVVKLPC